MCTSDGTATARALLENERVRVTEWRFQKRGDSTGWHRHEFDYLVIPLFSGTLEINLGNGVHKEAQLTQSIPYYREAGVEHDVTNGNDFECAFIEVELLENRKL